MKFCREVKGKRDRNAFPLVLETSVVFLALFFFYSAISLQQCVTLSIEQQTPIFPRSVVTAIAVFT